MAPTAFLRFLLASASLAAAVAFACGSCENGGPPPMAPNQLTLTCSPGVISAIDFASYGTPQGSCGSYSPGSCAAANSSAIVTSACLGSPSCTIWPNTSTFGDPCFGTVKTLVVQFECSASGSGAATCSAGPPPAPQSAALSINSSDVLRSLDSVPSLQVVSQRFLMADSEIHDASWAALAALTQLGLRHVRMVPWIPYSKVGVAELDPPSPAEYICSPMAWVGPRATLVNLDCGQGALISGIDFASYGTPSGHCGAYSVNPSCHAANSNSTLQALCVGKQACSVNVTSDFGATPPCNGAYLAAQMACSGANSVHTYWNFTLPDDLMLDFWKAANGDATAPIPNFSTQPNWLYDPTSWKYQDDASQPWYGYNSGAAPAVNGTLLGDYYGRLLAWYTRGGFVDEAGATHSSGHYLNITIWEVFNEVDYEHGHTVVSYTSDFDAVVSGIRRWADPNRTIAFVGMSLPNIDDTPTVVAWATYFLNASNHAPDARDALQYIGYHAYPNNGGYTPDPTTFEGMFAYVDDVFLPKVAAVDAVIAAQSPGTRTALDESGTDMDNVLSPGAPPSDNPRYWVASGGYFAYLFSRVSVQSNTVFVVGQSQFMDAPGQEPSVSILDWTTGEGTAKYWVLYMLLRTYALGDVYVGTSSNTTSLYAQASLPGPSNAAGWQLASLIINKVNADVSVTLQTTLPPGTPCNATIVDETTGNGAPRNVTCTSGALQLPPFAVAVAMWW